MSPRICLVIGGVRSGKSAFAENKVAEFDSTIFGTVLYVATGVAFDEEMKERIRKHRESRPPDWCTLDEPVQLAEKLSPMLRDVDTTSAVIIDSIDVWVTNLLMELQNEDRLTQEKIVVNETDKLLRLIMYARQPFVLVTSEGGLSLVSPEPLGRLFQDLLGMVNQRIAVVATEVYLVVAGIPNKIKSESTE